MAFFGRAGVMILLLALFAPLARADVAAQFPSPDRVSADYPEDVQRYAALGTLWDYSHAKAAESADAKAQRAAYYNAQTVIRQKYLAAGTAEDFDTKVRALDGGFGRAVLERYQLLDIAADRRLAPGQAPGDVTDAMIKGACVRAAPFAIAGVVMLWLVIRQMVRSSAANPSAASAPAETVAPLPENLRVVNVAGVHYAVAHLAGLVVDKDSAVHTEFTTRTTATRDPYALGSAPAAIDVRTTATAVSTQVDTLSVRGTDGRVMSWTLTGNPLQAQPGQVLSAVARGLREGSAQFVLVYNHATANWAMISYDAHAVRGFVPWLVGSLVAAIPFGLAVDVFLSVDPNLSTGDANDAWIRPLSYLIVGWIAAAALGVLVVVQAMGSAMRARNGAFARKYVPAYVQFFEQVSPMLRKAFEGQAGG